MVSTVTYGLLLACVALPGLALGDLAFRCPSCTADLLAACPKIPPFCPEIVRELGCGCCPVCARQEGELCGVYTPRCSSGLRCYPSAEAELPLQQLIQGIGRCGQRAEMDIYSTSLDEQATNEVHVTENPLTKRPGLASRCFQESIWNTEQNNRKKIMKVNEPDNTHTPSKAKSFQNVCEEELNYVMDQISSLTSLDSRGPLESLYELRFPNCDRHGLYNHKQCNMSTNGQRGECWCVNPDTGMELLDTPRVRGDPNC